MPREIIQFQCSECKNRNYSKTKNKRTTTERLELKKFCPFCRKHRRTAKQSKETGRVIRSCLGLPIILVV